MIYAAGSLKRGFASIQSMGFKSASRNSGPTFLFFCVPASNVPSKSEAWVYEALHGYMLVLPKDYDGDAANALRKLAIEIGSLEARVARDSDTDWSQMYREDYIELSWDQWKRPLKKWLTVLAKRTSLRDIENATQLVYSGVCESFDG